MALSSRIPGWKYLGATNTQLVKQAIYEGYPVIFGIPVDNSFMNIQTPYVWKNMTGNILGDHAMVVAGYDNNQIAFWVMNSWSNKWGAKGFVWIDYNLFASLVFPNAYIISRDRIK